MLLHCQEQIPLDVNISNIYILCFKIFLILNSLSQSTTGRGPLQYIFRLLNSDTTQFHNKQQIINKPHVFLVKWNVILKKKKLVSGNIRQTKAVCLGACASVAIKSNQLVYFHATNDFHNICSAV